MPMTPAELMVEGIRRRIDKGACDGSINISRRPRPAGIRFYAGGSKGYPTLEESLLSLCEGLDDSGVSQANQVTGELLDSRREHLKAAETICRGLLEFPESHAHALGLRDLWLRAKAFMAHR